MRARVLHTGCTLHRACSTLHRGRLTGTADCSQRAPTMRT